jgi:hypothetical protein
MRIEVVLNPTFSEFLKSETDRSKEILNRFRY